MTIKTCICFARVLAAALLLVAPAARADESRASPPPEGPTAAHLDGAPTACCARRPWVGLRPMDEFSANDISGFRGLSFGLGGRMVVGRYVSGGDGVDVNDVGSSSGSPTYGVGGTPVVDLVAEFGARRLRFALAAVVAPLPIGFSDFWTSTLFGVRVGALVGNERYRFGVTAGGGYFAWEALLHAYITPWRDRVGTRHGIGVDAGLWMIYPTASISYRVAPAGVNHARGRRAARRRARAAR